MAIHYSMLRRRRSPDGRRDTIEPMSLGDLTKQLAVQALSTPERPEKPAQTGPGETVGPTLLAQLQAMQKALKDDEELIILFRSGAETIVVREIYLPTWQVAVL